VIPAAFGSVFQSGCPRFAPAVGDVGKMLPHEEFFSLFTELVRAVGPFKLRLLERGGPIVRHSKLLTLLFNLKSKILNARSAPFPRPTFRKYPRHRQHFFDM
jgi:hypothetical protein